MQDTPCRVTIDTGAFVTVAKAIHRRVTAREEAWPTVRPASGFGMDDPHRQRGAGRAESGAAGPEGMGVRCRYNGRVHPRAGYSGGLRRVSERGTPCTTTGPGRVSSERSAYSVGFKAVEAYREPQKQAVGVLAIRWHRSSLERETWKERSRG
jgi:hypothetical protein